MDRVRFVEPEDVAPGDVGFDYGQSFYGRVASYLTGRKEAHCWVYHRPLGPPAPDGTRPWLVAELSGARGAVFAERTAPPTRVARVWRDEAERERLLETSRRIVASGTRYDWVEIARILYTLSGAPAPRRARRERQICADHVAACVAAARPDLAPLFADPDEVRWPRLVLARLIDDDLDPALVTTQLPLMGGMAVGAAGVEPATSRV